MAPDALPGELLVPQPTLADFPDFVSIPVRIARHAEAMPDRRAVVCEGKTRTWREFDRRINKIARTLAGMGIGKGDKIAILAANSVEYLETFMGGLRAGAWRSALATKTAQDMGLMPVAHLEGGLSAWKKAGGPVVKVEPKK